MKHPALVILALMFICSLQGCSLISANNESHTYWAKMGTPAKIVDTKEVKIIIKDENGKDQISNASLNGMMSIDQPTMEYYQTLHKLYGDQYLKSLNK